MARCSYCGELYEGRHRCPLAGDKAEEGSDLMSGDLDLITLDSGPTGAEGERGHERDLFAPAGGGPAQGGPGDLELQLDQESGGGWQDQDLPEEFALDDEEPAGGEQQDPFLPAPDEDDLQVAGSGSLGRAEPLYGPQGGAEPEPLQLARPARSSPRTRILAPTLDMDREGRGCVYLALALLLLCLVPLGWDRRDEVAQLLGQPLRPLCKIEVNTIPTSSKIYLDGVLQERRELRLERGGTHVLRVQAPGRSGRRTQFKADRDRTLMIRLK